MRPEMIEEAALLRHHWRVEGPSTDLAARIVAHATRLPQHKPWRLRLGALLRPLNHHWNMALIPGAAVAALMLVGVFDGQMRGLENDPAIDALIMESMIGNEDL